MQESGNKNLIKGTISLSLAVIITKILGVGFKVPLSYILGDSGMGYFNTAYAIYGFFYILCTAGVPKSLTLVLSEYRVKENGPWADTDILRCGLRLLFKIGIISTLLNIICAPALASLIGNKKALLSIVAVAPSILFVSLSGVLRGYLNSCEKLTAIAVSQLTEGAVKLVLGVALAFVGSYLCLPVYAISALAISGITIGSLISFSYLLLVTKKEKIDDNKRQNSIIEAKKIKKRVVKNAIPIALGSSLLNLSAILDLTIIIKRLTSIGVSEEYANSIYGNYTTLAVPMFNLVISVLAPIATSYMPRLSKMSISGEKSEFSSTINRLILITLLISVPASLAFYFYSFDLLDVLFSVQSSAVGASMLICLSCGVCMLSMLTVVNTALESMGRMNVAVFSLLIGCIVKLISGYILIGNSAFGIIGAPLGTVISYAVSLAVSLLALELGGCRTHSFFKLVFIYLVGVSSFYPFYRLIYSQGLFVSSFLSMSVALCMSFFIFGIMITGIYILKNKFSVFKMHKK